MNIKDLMPIGVIMVSVTILLAFGAKVLTDVGAGFGAGTPEAAIVANGTQALGTIGSNLNTLGLVLIAGIIVAAVVAAFYFKSR